MHSTEIIQTMFHHNRKELDNYFWTRPYQHLSFATFLCIADGPQSISKHIHSNHVYALTTQPYSTVTVRVLFLHNMH